MSTNPYNFIFVCIGQALLDLFVFNSEEVEKLIKKYEFIPKSIDKDDKDLNKVKEL